MFPFHEEQEPDIADTKDLWQPERQFRRRGAGGADNRRRTVTEDPEADSDTV
ncbi:hypothetical protein JCM37173_20690 [Allocoprococcus similis]